MYYFIIKYITLQYTLESANWKHLTFIHINPNYNKGQILQFVSSFLHL